MLYTVSVVLFKREKIHIFLHEYLFIQQENKSIYGLKGCVVIIYKVYTKHEGYFRLVSKYCCRFYKIRNVKFVKFNYTTCTVTIFLFTSHSMARLN